MISIGDKFISKKDIVVRHEVIHIKGDVYEILSIE